ncbi:MBL fold metallo-hydrolase [Streptomyces sp. NPDC054956]
MTPVPDSAAHPAGELTALPSLRLGEHRLTYLPDGHVQLDPRAWFPEAPAAYWEDKGSHLDDEGFLTGSIGALLVEHGDRALLIDTGFGPARIPADRTIPPLGRIEGGLLPDSLAAVGRGFASIDAVAFTHLHDDHVGWAFAEAPGGPGLLLENADFIASEGEWRGRPVPETAARALRGRIVTAADGDEVFPGVRVLATPGHTPGHTSYEIASGGSRLIVFGDVLHSPLQVAHPEWRVASDTDPAGAVRSRRRVLEELGRPGTYGFGGHFAGAVFGELVADGAGPRWRTLP